MSTKKAVLMVVCVFVSGAISNASLVAQWEFNESNGSMVLSDSIGTADGALDVGVGFVSSTAGVTGTGFGNAGDFSSTDNYAVLGTPGVLDLGTGDFTMTGWFKSPDVTEEDYYHMILENGQHGSGGVNLWLARGGRSYRGKFGFDIKGTDVNVSVSSDVRLDDNNWHWYAAIVSSGTASIYIDGVLQASSGVYGAGTTATAPESYVAKIGKDWSGLLDDMRVYDTALTGSLDGDTLISGDLYEIWQVPEPASLVLLSAGILFLNKRKKA